MVTITGRFAVAVGLVCLPGVAGCTWQKDKQAVEQQADECLLQLKALREKQAAAESGRQLLEAQRDRLEAANRELQRQIDELHKRERELVAEAEAARSQKRQVAQDLEAQRKELESALASVRQSRQQWEEALADRQKRIDLLTNQVERLRRQLDARRTATSTASAPP